MKPAFQPFRVSFGRNLPPLAVCRCSKRREQLLRASLDRRTEHAVIPGPPGYMARLVWGSGPGDGGSIPSAFPSAWREKENSRWGVCVCVCNAPWGLAPSSPLNPVEDRCGPASDRLTEPRSPRGHLSVVPTLEAVRKARLPTRDDPLKTKLVGRISRRSRFPPAVSGPSLSRERGSRSPSPGACWVLADGRPLGLPPRLRKERGAELLCSWGRHV